MEQDKDYKAQDQRAIEVYLQGGRSTQVADIVAHSGADRLRVYPLLFEMERSGRIVVIEVERLGAPKAVKLIEK